MKAYDFKAKLLQIVCPPVLDVYERELIPKFLDISKPALQKIISVDEFNPLLKTDWAYLYLDYERNYEKIKSGFISAISPQIQKTIPTDEIDDKLAKEFLDRIKKAFDLLDFNEVITDNLNFTDEPIDEIELFFIKASIVQFYNSLSVIQNGMRINDLLNKFIQKGKDADLIKAVIIDPSVLELPEVKDRINQLDPVSKNKIETKLQTAKSIPHLSPDKRKKYLLLAVFLNLAASLRYLCPPKPITNKRLQNLATELGLIPIDFDEEEFRKTASYYRKL